MIFSRTIPPYNQNKFYPPWLGLVRGHDFVKDKFSLIFSDRVVQPDGTVELFLEYFSTPAFFILGQREIGKRTSRTTCFFVLSNGVWEMSRDLFLQNYKIMGGPRGI